MAPKKKSVAGKGTTVFSEVERAFYELELADCNRKVARLRQVVSDYEIRYEKLQKEFDTLDEDRADIIAYLKKTLNAKDEENAELKEKVRGLEELREIETAQFKETVTELESNFTRMKDQLTSENKLLAGKLNTLEEFRAIREDLMKKFEKNELAFAEQEMKYKRIIYDTEKKFIIGKDKLKKEMEERLLQLAQDFQDASEMRIAASTHRVIRENIALNNQLDNLLMTQAKVAEQNEKFRDDERAARCAKEVAEEERDKAMNKSIVQLKVIDQLTAAFEDVKKQKALYDKKMLDQGKLQTKIQKLENDKNNLLLQVRILEQNLHAALSVQHTSKVETAKLQRESETYKNILKESEFAVQAALKLDNWATLDPTREILDREVVLNRIIDVIKKYYDAAEAQSTDSLISLSNIYKKGDLGFDVKRATVKKPEPVAAALYDIASLQSAKDKRSVVTSTSESSSTISWKTAPSIELIPPDEKSLPSPKDSIPSFTVTSLHSSKSTSTVQEETLDENDVTHLLAVSKLQVQQSLMADLALAQLSTMSTGRLRSTMEVMSHKHIAFSIKDDDEQNKTMPEDDESKPVQDTSEPAPPTSEPVTADAEGDEEKNIAE